jgi:type VI secretion system protein
MKPGVAPVDLHQLSKDNGGQCIETNLDVGEMAVVHGQDNDWVLSDSERLVFLKHRVINCIGGRYFVTDSSANGIELVVASIRLLWGNSERQEGGEIVNIGDHAISAEMGLHRQTVSGS